MRWRLNLAGGGERWWLTRVDLRVRKCSLDVAVCKWRRDEIVVVCNQKTSTAKDVRGCVDVI